MVNTAFSDGSAVTVRLSYEAVVKDVSTSGKYSMKFCAPAARDRSPKAMIVTSLASLSKLLSVRMTYRHCVSVGIHGMMPS